MVVVVIILQRDECVIVDGHFVAMQHKSSRFLTPPFLCYLSELGKDVCLIQCGTI